MPTMTFERCDSGCGKFDHNAYTPANPGDLGEPLRSADDSQVNITSYSPRRVDAPPRELTCARFREVAKARGWTLDWLVSQVGRSIEEPTRTLQRLLKESSPGTVIPYMCLIELVKGATLPPPGLRRRASLQVWLWRSGHRAAAVRHPVLSIEGFPATAETQP
jgi:hypothetical protein